MGDSGVYIPKHRYAQFIVHEQVCDSVEQLCARRIESDRLILVDADDRIEHNSAALTSSKDAISRCVALNEKNAVVIARRGKLNLILGGAAALFGAIAVLK